MANIDPKIINFLWSGPRWDRSEDASVPMDSPKRKLFQDEFVAKCGPVNKEFTIRLYLDAFMLLEPEKFDISRNKLRVAINEEKKVGPKVIQAMRDHLVERKNIFKDRAPREDVVKAALAKKSILAEDYAFFVDFCHGNKIELHFIDNFFIDNNDAIIKGAPHDIGKDHGHILWYSLFESMRITTLKGGRPNFGAASDVLRLHLIITEGGIYADHDTVFVSSFSPVTLPLGFRHGTCPPHPGDGERLAVPSNAIIAAVKGSEFLKKVCNHVVDMYGFSFKEADKFYNADVESLRDQTMRIAGPEAFRSTISQDDNLLNKKPDRRIEWKVAQPLSAGAWLDQKERNLAK